MRKRPRAGRNESAFAKPPRRPTPDSISRIDELAASFAEIEGTARSTSVFDEMTRILAEEGVDQALAYAATQRPGILEKVKARAAAAREKNRADLLPLLKSAQLQADRNQPAEADRLFADILALEPDWPDARNAFAWFLIQRGEVIEPVEGNAKLREAVQICQGTLALNQRGKSPQAWAATQNNLGIALQEQGRRTAGAQGARTAGPSGGRLPQRPGSQNPRASAAGLGQDPEQPGQCAPGAGPPDRGRPRAELLGPSGDRLPQRPGSLHPRAAAPELGHDPEQPGPCAPAPGRRTGGAEGTELLAQAVDAYRSALEVRTREQLPQDWAKTQNNLGNALQDQGRRGRGRQRRRAAGPGGERLPQRPGSLHPRAAAAGLGHDPEQPGQRAPGPGPRQEGAKGAELLAQAVTAYRSALEVSTREQLPQDWARTQNNLGIALGDQGARTEGAKGARAADPGGGGLPQRPGSLHPRAAAPGLGHDPEQPGHRALGPGGSDRGGKGDASCWPRR